MRHYELVVILSPMLNQEQSADAWGRIKGFINNRDSDIFHEENWGTRRLAYSIRKGPYHFLEGTYHLTRFSTESPFNRELETFLRLDEQVLRSLLVVTGPPQPTPEPPPVVEQAATEEPTDEADAVTTDADAEFPAAVAEAVEAEDAVAAEPVAEAPAPAEAAVEAEDAVAAEPVAEAPAPAEAAVEAEDTVAAESAAEASTADEEPVAEAPAPAEAAVEEAADETPESVESPEQEQVQA